ncbi:MAG: DUF6941 family protein [Streptosporangiaceae bacterium]
MPALEYLVLADYVRQDAGMTHIMGAGLDTINVPVGQLPIGLPVGLVARISFNSRDDVGADHELKIVFHGPPGDLLTVTHRFKTPPPPPGLPDHWPTAMSIALRIPLPVPSHGNYQLRATLDDDPQMSKLLDVRAIEPPQPGA